MTTQNNEDQNSDMQRFLDWNLRKFHPELERNREGLTYVASPYWDPDPEVIRARRRQALEATIRLVNQRITAFCPVVYTSELHLAGAHGENWYDFDLTFLARAERMVVLKIPGWDKSRGILIEIGFAKARGIPVYGMDP